MPRLWPLFVLCAFAALLADFGNLHRLHQIDSLTPVLVSLQRWTPFFWCQDRIGMLVPLLALPVRNPLDNLLLQEGIYLFAGLAAMFLLARYLVVDPTYPIVGAVMTGGFLALTPAEYRFDFFNTTFYGVWLALGLGGLLLAQPGPAGSLSLPRQAGAFLLLVLAHWVYIGAALVLAPLVVARAVCGRSLALEDWRPGRLLRTEAGQAVALLAGSMGVGLLLTAFSPYHQSYAGTLPPRDWPVTAWTLAANSWSALAPGVWVWFLLGLFGCGLLALALGGRGNGRVEHYLRVAAAPALAATVYWLFVATRTWVATNQCVPRYALPAVFLLQGALVVTGVGALLPILEWVGPRILNALVAPALLGAVLIGYGLPSPTAVRADLDRALGDCTEDIVASHCTHLAGDCFTVWPRVFHVNLVLYERGERRTFWGISYRSDPTCQLWNEMPRERMRVAIAAGDTEGQDWLNEFGVGPLEVTEARPTIQIYGKRGLRTP